MDIQKMRKLLIRAAVIYWIAVLMIFLIAGDSFRYTAVKSDTCSPSGVIGEITDGEEITQLLNIDSDLVDEISLDFATYEHELKGKLRFALTDESGTTVATAEMDCASLKDNRYCAIPFDSQLAGCKGKALTLHITAEGCEPGAAPTIYHGNTVAVGKVQVAMSIPEEERYAIDGVPGEGTLLASVTGRNHLSFYIFYWPLVAVLFALLAVWTVIDWRRMLTGRKSVLSILMVMILRYGFLIRKLVSRDFKTKYKRSALGMIWSFLNPMLTMAVQYFVFSTLFKSNIPNYPLYLLIGIVMFNFFNEACSLAMTSITGNASLIKKIYVPKYVYPVSRVLSSGINFSFAMIPIIFVMIFTGAPFTFSILLMVYVTACMLLFITGMSMILATAMTFFQDMQFLWGVISMIWMYLTPIIYPESLIPEAFRFLYHMNPMYQYVTFARTLLIDGVSPAPQCYLYCLAAGVLVLLLGAWVFKKNQDKFVLYL